MGYVLKSQISDVLKSQISGDTRENIQSYSFMLGKLMF